MHKSKWSKKLRMLISVGAVTTMLVPNALQVSALTNENPKTKSIRNDYDSIHNKSNITVNKMDKNIDIQSQSEVSVIVEFNSPALAQAQSLNKSKSSLQNDIQKDHREFKDFLNKSKKDKSVSEYKITREYENVYNGVAMTLKGSEVESLLKSNVVKKIWNNDIFQLELPKEDEVKSDISPRMNDSVPHIGADKLHNEGLKGKGIKVGVLDTGVDYNHPDLKDNYKGGYDFVDNDNDPMETTYKDWQESGNPEFSGSVHITHLMELMFQERYLEMLKVVQKVRYLE